jgi:hypothetical protein
MYAAAIKLCCTLLAAHTPRDSNILRLQHGGHALADITTTDD